MTLYHSKQAQSPDPYISAVLDAIHRVSGHDPEWIEPDTLFERDLEFRPDQILTIGRLALEHLDIKFGERETTLLSRARSPRELVDMLRDFVNKTLSKAS